MTMRLNVMTVLLKSETTYKLRFRAMVPVDSLGRLPFRRV